MKILVTGGTGFLGSALTEELGGKHIVVSVGRRNNNLLDQEETMSVFSSCQPDAVVHLAANVGGIGKNERMPGTLAYENLMMGLNVIESCRAYRVRKLVVIGTICSYPKFTPVPFKESDIWNGYPEETNAPYGIAKKAILVTGQAYRKEFGMNIVHLLMVNLYGPRDNFDLEDSHVIPAMIRKFEEAKKTNSRTVTLWGDGSPSREFLFVRDAAKAISMSLEKYDSSEPINIGSGREITIKELAEKVADTVGYQGSILWNGNRPNGQPRRCLDVSKAASLIGWKASTSLEDGLKETYSWWKNKTDNKDQISSK
jgi:GDP-L-fucose synthase